MTDIRSAAERHEEGCPEPASVVAFSESIRSRLPFSFSTSMGVDISVLYRRARDPITKHTNAFDFNFDGVAGLHRLRVTRCARVNDVARNQSHELTDVADDHFHWKDKIL